MKQFFTKIFLLLTLALGLNYNSIAQCIAPTSYSSLVAPGCPVSTSAAFIGGAWGGEYVPMSGVVAGNTYQVAQTAGNTYFTITDIANVVVAFGTSPVSFTAPSAGTFRIHNHLDAACTTNNVNTNFTVTLTAAPTAAPPYLVANGTVAKPACPINSMTSYTGTALGGQYVEITGITAAEIGNTYTLTSTLGNTAYTITDAANVTVAAGVSPLAFTPTAAGVYRVHVQGSTCLVSNFSVTLSALPPPAPLSGTYTIPGGPCGFPDLATMCLALNTYGVSGPVIVNLIAPQTAPAGGYILGSAILNASTNATNTLTFNGNGNTLSGFTGGTSTTVDAIFRIAGTDYVSINQMHLAENAANITTATQMEQGYAIMALGTDGAQNINITGCNVNLNGPGQHTAAAETGIYVTSKDYLAITPIITNTIPTTAAHAFGNIKIKGCTVNNCWQGIYIHSGSTAPTVFPQNIEVGGYTAAEGNTILNHGSPSSAFTLTNYVLQVYGCQNVIISNNTLTATAFPIWNASYHIYPYYLTGDVVVSKNTISFATAATSTGGQYGIYSFNSHQLININRMDSNIVQNVTLGGSNLFYGLYHYVSTGNIIGAMNTNNNVVNNITRPTLGGTMYGVYSYCGVLKPRTINNNVITNFNNTTSGATTSTWYLFYPAGTGSTSMFQCNNNLVENASLTGAGTGSLTCYSLYNLTFGNLEMNDNRIGNITANNAATTASVFGIYGSNTSGTQNWSRNNVYNLSETRGLGTVDGMFLTGAAVRNITNNFVSGLTAPNLSADNAIKGINVVGGTNNLYNNTIYIGSGGFVTSAGANFGVSGIVWNGATAGLLLESRNNIVNLNCNAKGVAITAALRNLSLNKVGYATTSNNNIYFAAAGTNRYHYAECAFSSIAVTVNSHNNTTDPGFNSPCGLWKTYMSPADAVSFQENNLIAGALPNTFVPTGASLADNSAQTGLVTVDYALVTRAAFPDRGALEFSGASPIDASGPTITYAPITSSTYCTTLPTINATITDVSGVSTTNPPRLYYKYTGNNDTYVGNTSADNGWKYVVGTGAAPNYTFAMNAALLTAIPVINDVIQYFIVAEDMATVPNFSSSIAAFTTCPTTVVLPLAVFPTLATPVKNQMTIIAAPAITMVATATPATVCLGTNSTLTLKDTLSGPQGLTAGYCLPVAPAQNATRFISSFVTTGGLANINSVTGDAGASTYENYYSLSTNYLLATPGSSIGFTSAGTPTAGWTIYVDWDRNGIFNTTNEKIYTTAGFVSNIAGSMTIPATASGAYRMRVLYNWSVSANIEPCNTLSSPNEGETEDYAINIVVPNSFPNGSITWAPTSPATIVTNPNRTVSANVINATTIFTVTATDAGGCTYTATTQVTVNPLTAGSATATPLIVCAGDSSQFAVAPAGGGAPYTYSWLPAAGLSNVAIGNPKAAPATTTIYTVTVADACGSSYTQTNVVIVNPIPTVTGTATPAIVCPTATTTLTGSGTASSYSWSGGVTNGVAFVPAASSVYTVTGTSINGCTATSTVQVIKTAPFYDTTGNNATICFGGSANLIAGDSMPPLPPYCVPTYTSGNLSGDFIQAVGGFITNVTGVNPATYTNYAAPTGALTVGTPSLLNVTMGTYTLNDVAVWVDYNKNNVFEAAEKIGEFFDLGSGAIAAFAINAPGTALNGPTRMRVREADQATTSNLNPCVSYGFGETEDYTVIISGGVTVVPPVYTYTWMPGSLVGAAQTVMPIATTTYTVTQTDANGCTTTATQMVTVNPNPTTTVTATTVASCAPGCDATATMNATGGTSPYAYTVSASATTAGNVVSAICATTTYTVTATDANGCVGTVSTTGVGATPPTAATITATTPATCLPGCDGTATVSTTGGTSPYVYTATASATVASNIVSAICNATTYTITSTDAMGCAITTTTTGTQTTAPTVTATPISSTVCPGANVTFTGGGASTYTWSGGVINASPFAVAAATIFTVTGTDANGCTGTATSDIMLHTLPTVTATPATLTTCQNTMATLIGGGAVSYTWSGSITNNTPFSVTSSNIYTVTGTDANGCTNTATSDVIMTAAPVITATPNTANNCVGSATDLTASGGLTYVWMPGTLAGTTITVPAYTGSATYTVTGTDAGGCTGTATAVLTTTVPGGNLTQATATNAASVAGTQCETTTQPNDGQPLGYFDNSCNIIAKVQEPLGGTSLGPVTTCVTIEPSTPNVNGQPYVARWYDISPTVQGPANVTLFFTDADFINYNAGNGTWPDIATNAGSATTAAVCITQISGTAPNQVATVHPATATWNATTLNWEVTFPVTGFSQFYCHTCNPFNAPLPVSYKSFTARKENTVDVLDWITGSEENNKQFNVERSSNNKEFTKIGVIASKAPNGNSQIDISYTFIDEKPLSGHNYYRLAQEDIDGKINYSEVIDLVWGANGSTISMYPNPTTDVLNVDINSEKASNITIRVMDMSGRTVKTTEARTEQGVNSVKINLSEVSSGIYNVQIVENGKLIVTERVNKK